MTQEAQNLMAGFFPRMIRATAWRDWLESIGYTEPEARHMASEFSSCDHPNCGDIES